MKNPQQAPVTQTQAIAMPGAAKKTRGEDRA